MKFRLKRTAKGSLKVKRKKICNTSNKFVRVLYLFKKIPILDPNYPHSTLYNREFELLIHAFCTLVLWLQIELLNGE